MSGEQKHLSNIFRPRVFPAIKAVNVFCKNHSDTLNSRVLEGPKNSAPPKVTCRGGRGPRGAPRKEDVTIQFNSVGGLCHNSEKHFLLTTCPLHVWRTETPIKHFSAHECFPPSRLLTYSARTTQTLSKRRMLEGQNNSAPPKRLAGPGEGLVAPQGKEDVMIGVLILLEDLFQQIC
ncbi:hypothetical protein CEXT_33901 [Caerostris extrusa]|uniref:Uncharacterized protein n=1 Tax=Caerostris extrusa TaxID=172846 RepID=A0AAV4N2J3_CAEEX|nr:hypothetical protein CEXT_33901 [Caerostris extrusa]